MMTSSRWIQLAIISSTLTLTACGGDPDWEEVYEACKERMDKVMTMNKMDAPSNTPPAMQAMVQSIAMNACGAIKNTCEAEPDGELCQTIVENYKKEMQ